MSVKHKLCTVAAVASIAAMFLQSISDISMNYTLFHGLKTAHHGHQQVGRDAVQYECVA